MPLAAPTSYNNLTLDSRLKSFTKTKSKPWPHNSSYKATPDTLARAGFVFTPDGTKKSDRVTCFVCAKTLGGWEPEDDPFKEHAEHSPSCSWALARCSIEALRVSPESTELIFPNEESLPSSATLEAARLATFGKLWPHDSVRSHSAKSKHMAKAGFIYTPTQESEDLASCFYCNLGLDGWESTDDPHHEHQRRRSQCAFFSARVSAGDQSESQPKRAKGKSTKKPQTEDSDAEEERPAPPPKPKKATAGVKRTTSKSSKAAPPSDPEGVKQESADDEPPPTRGKLRKSQSHGQLQLGRSALGKSASQPERSQSALGRPIGGRSQSRLGHRAGETIDDDDDDERPPVPAKSRSKATSKSKKAAPEPEPEIEEPEPTRAKTKTRLTKKPVSEAEEEPESEPRPKFKTKSGKSKTKPAPEPQPEPEEEEEEEVPPPPPPKAKTKTKAKATGAKAKKGGKKVVEDPVESSNAEMEVEPGIEADSAAEPETEPEPAPKKTRAKKTAATKKTTRGKKAKAKVGTGDDTESQAEVETDDVHMQSYSESEPPAASTPRPPSRLASRADENTPRAGAGPIVNAKPAGLPVPSRSTPSPTRLARPGTFGTPRGPSQPGSAANTPKQVTVGSGIARPPSASGIGRPPSATGIARPPSATGIVRPPSASGIARPPSTTGIPRPGTTTPGSAGTPRTGLPLRQPSPTRAGVARPVFGALNRNNSNTDVVMASPGRPMGSPSRPGTSAPASPTRPATRPLSQMQSEVESNVPFPRESSPMTPGRPLNTTKPAVLAPATATTTTAPNGAAVDVSMAELDAETRALTLEAYVRREMGIQYDTLKAECEREIEDFLKAASETRAKIAAL